MKAVCPEGCWETPLPETWTEAMLRMMTCPDCHTRLEVDR